MPSKGARLELSGESVLYPYLQKELLHEDIWLFQLVATRLVTALGIWIHPKIYVRSPLLLPHAVRDQYARSHHSGENDQWGAPNQYGYLRDDNSLIKEIVKCLEIQSSRPHYKGRQIGRAGGWVASHVWQKRRNGDWASQHHLTNSFVPNLVWLPTPLSRLSDRSGSFVQAYLQALSYKLYRHEVFAPAMRRIVDRAWRELKRPEIPEQGLAEMEELNFFSFDEAWFERRQEKLRKTAESIEEVAQGRPALPGLKPTRYRNGLRRVPGRNLRRLASWLREYIRAGEQSKSVRSTRRGP
jgi:hypothetical protein